MQVSIRELKSGLSRYLKAALAGEEVVVTSRRKPIARFVAMPRAPAGLLPIAGVTWSSEPPDFDDAGARLPTLNGPGPTLSDLVLAGRG